MSENIPSTLEELVEAVGQSGKTVVLFTQPSFCAPCRAFKPHWDTAVNKEDSINFVYANLDTVPDAMAVYGIRSVPTVKLYEYGTFVRDVKAPQGAVAFLNDIRS